MKTEILSFSLTDNILLPDSLIIYGTKFPSGTGNPEDYLSEDEICKYNRLKISEQAVLQKSCRAILKILLGKYTSQKPENIQLKTNRFGKPYLENSGVWFNVSHNGTAFIINISKKGRIGIDMEDGRIKWDLKAMSDYAFSNTEKRNIRHQEDFLRIWTLKEALLKTVGVGLINQLTKIDTPDIIKRYKLYNVTFICPGGEIASVISNVNFEKTCYLIAD